MHINVLVISAIQSKNLLIITVNVQFYTIHSVIIFCILQHQQYFIWSSQWICLLRSSNSHLSQWESSSLLNSVVPRSSNDQLWPTSPEDITINPRSSESWTHFWINWCQRENWKSSTSIRKSRIFSGKNIHCSSWEHVLNLCHP